MGVTSVGTERGIAHVEEAFINGANKALHDEFKAQTLKVRSGRFKLEAYAQPWTTERKAILCDTTDPTCEQTDQHKWRVQTIKFEKFNEEPTILLIPEVATLATPDAWTRFKLLVTRSTTQDADITLVTWDGSHNLIEGKWYAFGR